MKSDLRLYSISDQYISFLRSDAKLKNVFDNKEDKRVHTRKYLGMVLEHKGLCYYAPFSSPKASDYITAPDGQRQIRKSIVPIIRMTTTDTVTKQPELKGTLKLSNMIPVPKEELTPYDISRETDRNYKMIVQKEYSFITANANLILKNASVLYKQKTNENVLYQQGDKKPGYLSEVIPFTYAEQKCIEYCKLYNLSIPAELIQHEQRAAQLSQDRPQPPEPVQPEQPAAQLPQDEPQPPEPVQQEQRAARSSEPSNIQINEIADTLQSLYEKILKPEDRPSLFKKIEEIEKRQSLGGKDTPTIDPDKQK